MPPPRKGIGSGKKNATPTGALRLKYLRLARFFDKKNRRGVKFLVPAGQP
jgi:hypothetical protein